jgi:hypothetical protein
MRRAEKVEAGKGQFGYARLQIPEELVERRLVFQMKVPVVRIAGELHGLTSVED